MIFSMAITLVVKMAAVLSVPWVAVALPTTKKEPGTAHVLTCKTAMAEVGRGAVIQSVVVAKEGVGPLFYYSARRRVVNGPLSWDYHGVGLNGPGARSAGYNEVRVKVSMYSLRSSDSGTYSCQVNFHGQSGWRGRKVTVEVLSLEVKGESLGSTSRGTGWAEMITDDDIENWTEKEAMFSMLREEPSSAANDTELTSSMRPGESSVDGPRQGCPEGSRKQMFTEGCVCLTPGHRYNAQENTCRLVCPPGSTLDTNEQTCNCEDKHRSYSRNANECKLVCPDRASFDKKRDTCECEHSKETFTESKWQCVPQCPAGSKLDEAQNVCACNNDKLTFDREVWKCLFKCPAKSVKDEEEDNSCLCIESRRVYDPDTNTCKLQCPDDAKEDENVRTCRCNDENFEYLTISNECQKRCPEGSSRDITSRTCKCSDPSKSYNPAFGLCVILKNECPTGATVVDEKCVCTVPHKTYDEQAKTCNLNCPASTSANLVTDTCDCVNPTLRFVWETQNCRTPCPEGSVQTNQGSCECRLGKRYNLEKNVCEADCPPHSSYKVSRCVCDPGFSKDNILQRCSLKCPPGAMEDAATTKCVCKRKDRILDERENRCVKRCPTNATLDEKTGSCTCADPNKIFNVPERACLEKCPLGTETDVPTGTCKCRHPNMKFSVGLYKCECSLVCADNMTLDPAQCACHCDVGCPLDQKRKDDSSCDCVCADSRYELDKGFCVRKKATPSPTTTAATTTTTTTTTRTTTKKPTTTTKMTTRRATKRPEPITTTAKEETHINRNCKLGWIYFSKEPTCVKIFHRRKTWMSARAICKKLAGDLVTILTPTFDDFLTGLVGKSNGKPFWIGLNDRIMENSFRWLDQFKMSVYMNWAGDSPDGREDQNCVEKGFKGGGYWNDFDCEKQAKFICERAIEPTGDGRPGGDTPFPTESPGGEDQFVVAFVVLVTLVLLSVCIMMALPYNLCLGYDRLDYEDNQEEGDTFNYLSEQLELLVNKLIDGNISLVDSDVTKADSGVERVGSSVDMGEWSLDTSARNLTETETDNKPLRQWEK